VRPLREIGPVLVRLSRHRSVLATRCQAEHRWSGGLSRRCGRRVSSGRQTQSTVALPGKEERLPALPTITHWSLSAAASSRAELLARGRRPAGGRGLQSLRARARPDTHMHGSTACGDGAGGMVRGAVGAGCAGLEPLTWLIAVAEPDILCRQEAIAGLVVIATENEIVAGSACASYTLSTQTGLADGTRFRRVHTPHRRIAGVVRAGITVVTIDPRVDTACGAVASVPRASVSIVAVDSGSHTRTAAVAAIVLGAGVVIIAGPPGHWRVDTVARRRVAAVIRADIAVVAIDRRVDAFAVHTRVGGAQIVVVATDATAAAILDVGIEVWVDGVAVGFVGRDSARVDFDLDEGVLLRMRAVTDRHLVLLLGHDVRFAALAALLRRGIAYVKRGQPGQDAQGPPPRDTGRQSASQGVEFLIVHARRPPSMQNNNDSTGPEEANKRGFSFRSSQRTIRKLRCSSRARRRTGADGNHRDGWSRPFRPRRSTNADGGARQRAMVTPPYLSRWRAR